MPKESSHKEILTKETIRKELLRDYRMGAIQLLILIPPCVLILWAIRYFASFLNEIWYNIIFYGLLSLFAVAYIQGVVTLIIAIFRIHNDKIEIFTDKLMGLEDAADSFCKNTRRAFRYTLYFVSGYKYEIPKGIHYTWSSIYEMEDHGVFRSSDVGDLFYLISMDRKTILLAYNTKMFEYCESNEGNNKSRM